MRFRCFIFCRVCWGLIALTLFACAPHPARADGHKRALLIGISRYDHFNKSGLFPNLDCDEDIVRIQAALVKTFQFDPATQVTTLKTPAQTTRSAIIGALTQLVQDTQPGDIVYIHYSGHGTQVPDAASPGELDDSLVPSDYSDDLRKNITGKEVAAYLKELQGKKPRQITLSFDCCHSATATRGAAKMRGMTYQQYAAQYQRIHGTHPPQSGLTRGSSPEPENIPVGELANSGCVVLSACANNACAYETKDEDGKNLGRFSECLSRVLSEATPQTTYQQVYDRVRALFREKYSDQAPQIDGNPNTLLLGGTAVAPVKSLLVTGDASGHYTLDAGKLQGMTPASSVTVYDRNTQNFAATDKIADAAISHVGLTSSSLVLTKQYRTLRPTDFSGAYALETLHNYGNGKLTVDAQSLRTALPAQASEVLKDLQDTRLVAEAAPDRMADVRLLRRKDQAGGPGTLAVVRGDTGTLLTTLPQTSDSAAALEAALRKLAQYRYATTVLNKEDPASEVQIHMRLVPAVVSKDSAGHVTWKSDGPLRPGANFRTGDYFTVEVQDRSDEDVFLTVLDIDSDGTIGQAWPKTTYLAADNVIPSGSPKKWTKLWNDSDTTSIKLFQCSAPDAAEMYKAIATDAYVNLHALVNRGASASPGPFDALIGPAAGIVTRGPENIEAPSGWGTSTFPFSVSAQSALPTNMKNH